MIWYHWIAIGLVVLGAILSALIYFAPDWFVKLLTTRFRFAIHTFKRIKGDYQFSFELRRAPHTEDAGSFIYLECFLLLWGFRTEIEWSW